MFKIIDPEYHCFYKPFIDRFMNLIQSCSLEFSERDQNRATFILTDDKDNGVYGGALLVRKRLHNFPPELVKSLSDFISPKECMWECFTALSIDNDSPLYETEEIESFCQLFYRNLHTSLVNFGKKKGTGFLCISLFSVEYFCTEGLIFWPYVLELKPQESSDGLFHGVLPLIGSQSQAYQLQIPPSE